MPVGYCVLRFFLLSGLTWMGPLGAAAAVDSPAVPLAEDATTIASPGTHEGAADALAHRLRLRLMVGEVMTLQSGDEDYLAILRRAEETPPKGAVIINIDPSIVVDSKPLHRVFARTLAAANWTVLSLHPPPDSLAPEILAIQVAQQFDAALAYLGADGIENVVIVGDGRGADSALAYVREKRSPAISGFAGIGSWTHAIGTIEIPILNVIGTRDKSAMHHRVLRERKFENRAVAVEYVEIVGAGPGFYGYEPLVAKRTRGWLERTTPGILVRR